MNSNSITGTWKLDPDDILAVESYGEVIIEFKKNGELVYSLIKEDEEQKIFMTYKIIDNILQTNQPSKPGIEETAFVLSDYVLELYFDGVKSSFIRVSL